MVFTCEAGARALGARQPDARAFRTTVCRLRKKLNALHASGPIETVRGVGYVYAPSGRGVPDDGRGARVRTIRGAAADDLELTDLAA